MNFPNRSELNKNKKLNMDNNNNIIDTNIDITDTNYRNILLGQLNNSLNNINSSQWKDEPNVKIREIEKQKEFFWIRVYLKDDDTVLKVGDIISISYRPTNEKMDMIFGGYEKEGLNKNHNDQVINYVSESDRSILICLVDLNRVNKDSEDIPTIRTFFRNSRHYAEDIFYKNDIVISTKDKEYEYRSIDF